MKVLITGGAGFIGSHLAAFLHGRSEVRILDNLRGGSRRSLEGPNPDMIEASVLEMEALRAAVSGVDIVFHLAAMISAKESMENPRECVEINTLGTLNVLRAAADAGVRKLVFASSAAVYGDDPPVPTVETATPKPKSPYAITKLDGEYYCEMFAREGWLNTASLRFFNVFGPGQDPAGPYAAAVPAFANLAVRGEPLTIFGDGEQSRDFIYVKDAVSGLVFAAENGDVTGVFNCGYGHQTTINELTRRILARVDSRSPIVHLPERAGDVRHSCASTKKLCDFGWQPVSSLDDGLRETLEGFRQRVREASASMRSR
ncbi:MAG: NAD-dependent epimerase/dehydratase family protein [Terrimicrobiaceae bacterium]